MRGEEDRAGGTHSHLGGIQNRPLKKEQEVGKQDHQEGVHAQGGGSS